jgi:hypothetical protein
VQVPRRVRTPAKRDALARIVDGWIAGCAAAGFRAVEFDNLDSFTRSGGAVAFADAHRELTVVTSVTTTPTNLLNLLECHRASGIAYGRFCRLRLEELNFVDHRKGICFAYPPASQRGGGGRARRADRHPEIARDVCAIATRRGPPHLGRIPRYWAGV